MQLQPAHRSPGTRCASRADPDLSPPTSRTLAAPPIPSSSLGDDLAADKVPVTGVWHPCLAGPFVCASDTPISSSAATPLARPALNTPDEPDPASMTLAVTLWAHRCAQKRARLARTLSFFFHPHPGQLLPQSRFLLIALPYLHVQLLVLQQ
jgi:hypothetical protein